VLEALSSNLILPKKKEGRGEGRKGGRKNGKRDGGSREGGKEGRTKERERKKEREHLLPVSITVQKYIYKEPYFPTLRSLIKIL
jgi:hypothetical protein